MAGVATLLAWGIYFLLRVECFRWTHYPVRFDRKHQLVHVFSVDGEVYSVPWDDVFFTTGCYTKPGGKRRYYDIRGHVLAEDRKTVLKTFTWRYPPAAESSYIRTGSLCVVIWKKVRRPWRKY